MAHNHEVRGSSPLPATISTLTSVFIAEVFVWLKTLRCYEVRVLLGVFTSVCYTDPMKTKAIIFDIDGTALDSPSQKAPSEKLAKAVRAVENEYYMCAATGRVWTFAEPALKGLSLVDPCIISAGAQICNPATGDILWQLNLAPTDLKTVVSIVQQYPDFKVLYNDNDEEAYLQGGIEPNNLDIDEPVYFLEQIFVPQEVAPEIVAKLSALEGIAVTLVIAHRPGFNDIHVTNRNATKEHAVAKLLDLIHVTKENTVGVGDGNNDIHLFNAVKHKVAMGNAVNELKELADETIGNVEEEGFAAYLEKLNSSTVR
jgi:HAD superfamily hydrolase (TIGR01484 family)